MTRRHAIAIGANNARPPCARVQPAFPTSDLSLLANGDVLNLLFRGFDGAMYSMQQLKAGDAAGKFGPAVMVGTQDDPNSILE